LKELKSVKSVSAYSQATFYMGDKDYDYVARAKPLLNPKMFNLSHSGLKRFVTVL